MTAAAPRLATWSETYETKDVACVARPDSTLPFDEIAPGVFVHMGNVADVTRGNRGDISNIGFIIGAESVAVIDAGGSRAVGEQVYLAVRAQTDKPISHLILTHFHPDHIYGASALTDAGAHIVAHVKYADGIAARAETYETNMNRLMGDTFIGSETPREVGEAVADIAEIDLGDRVLELRAWPLAHTSADMTILDRETGTFFAGDLLFHLHTPAIDGSILGWDGVVASWDSLRIERVVPGHGATSLPWPGGATAQTSYFETLKADARRLIDEGVTLGEAAELIGLSEAENWSLFDLFNPRNATVVYTELEWE